MLVDIKKRPANLRNPIIAYLDSIDIYSGNKSHPRTGVYIDHLNFRYDVDSNIRDAYMYIGLKHYAKSLEQYIAEAKANNKQNVYDEKELEKWKAIPDNIESLYKFENWRKPKDGESHYHDYPTVLNFYGVCDSVEQFLSLYDFEADPRKLVLFLTEIRREDQPPRDGWRWHKWGEYYGMHTPQHEYLYDEKDIKEVYVFHIYEVLD